MREVEFPYCFAAVIVHTILGHPDAFQRYARRSLGEVVGYPSVRIGQRQNGSPREFDPWRLDTGDHAQHGKDFPQREVAIAENISVAHPSTIHGAVDFAFLRAYEDGKPANTTKHYFKWKPGGAKQDELVFVSGNPGTTKRLLTTAQLELERDIGIPMRIEQLRNSLRISNIRSSMTIEQITNMLRISQGDNTYSG